MRSRLLVPIAAACLALAVVARADTLDSLHCNDAAGAPLLKGHAIAVTGIVTAQFSTARNARLFVQGPWGAVNVFGAPANCALVGDSIRVAGEVGGYNGLTEIIGDADDDPLKITPLGHGGLPAPLELDVRGVAGSERPGGCEPDESRLVALPHVTIRSMRGDALADTSRFREDTTYLIAPMVADSTTRGVPLRVLSAAGCPGATTLAGTPIPHGALTVVGILSQYLPRGTAHGGYQILPRGPGDLRPAGPDGGH